jgi:hypothetical protein
VLAESDYMLADRLGQVAAREFLDDVATEASELVDFDAATFGRRTGSSTATRTFASPSRMRHRWCV